MSLILVVEDEPHMQRGLKDNLECEGYTVECANDGAAALQQISQQTFDLIILDLMLPTISGLEVCKKVRAQGLATPILILTAKSEEVDKVIGLELGADDYVTKPFGLREILARIKALLRRSEGTVTQSLETVTLGTLQIHFESYSALQHGVSVPMTSKEIEILKYLWQHRNKTVSRDDLLTNVWGYDTSISTRTIDNFILKLRQKIEADPAHPTCILTIHGVGYKLIHS